MRGAAVPLTTGQRPGQRHQQVSQVVGVADQPPPARHQQALARGRGDAPQVCGDEGRSSRG